MTPVGIMTLVLSTVSLASGVSSFTSFLLAGDLLRLGVEEALERGDLDDRGVPPDLVLPRLALYQSID